MSSTESRKERPQALNTVELLRVASSGLGLSPAQTMSTAEYLYTRVYSTFPNFLVSQISQLIFLDCEMFSWIVGVGTYLRLMVSCLMYVELKNAVSFQGFISYPRTETTAYPSNFDFIEALRQQQNDSRWKDVVNKVVCFN